MVPFTWRGVQIACKYKNFRVCSQLTCFTSVIATALSLLKTRVVLQQALYTFSCHYRLPCKFTSELLIFPTITPISKEVSYLLILMWIDLKIIAIVSKIIILRKIMNISTKLGFFAELRKWTATLRNGVFVGFDKLSLEDWTSRYHIKMSKVLKICTGKWI